MYTEPQIIAVTVKQSKSAMAEMLKPIASRVSRNNAKKRRFPTQFSPVSNFLKEVQDKATQSP